MDLAAALREHGYDRAYFHHIRRVGGTSLNETFFSLISRNPKRVTSNIRRSIRSEEHTSELQSLMRISYAVFCLKKKKYINNITYQPFSHYTITSNSTTHKILTAE